MYGLAETSAAYVLTRMGDDISVRYNAVGKPGNGVEAAVWDGERGILPPEEAGEKVCLSFLES